MLQNTRGRTVFAFQPKRLPKDVDRWAGKCSPHAACSNCLSRLTFFQGSIVRKKSLGAVCQPTSQGSQLCAPGPGVSDDEAHKAGVSRHRMTPLPQCVLEARTELRRSSHRRDPQRLTWRVPEQLEVRGRVLTWVQGPPVALAVCK